MRMRRMVSPAQGEPYGDRPSFSVMRSPFASRPDSRVHGPLQCAARSFGTQVTGTATSVSVLTLAPETKDGTKDELVQSRRWWILGVLCICLMVVVIDNTILNVALPSMQEQLHASQSQEQWFIDAYTLVFAALLFTGGVAGDRWGRRRLLFVGVGVFGAAAVLSAFSSSPPMLLGSPAVVGSGGGRGRPPAR